MACAPPMRKTRSSPEQPARRQDLRAGMRAGYADGLHAGNLRRESQSSTRWRAGDSVRRECKRPSSPADARSVPSVRPSGSVVAALARHLHSGIFADVGRRSLRGVDEIRPAARRRQTPARALAHRVPVNRSNLRAYSSSASSPRSRTASRIGATTRSASARRMALRVTNSCASESSTIRSMLTSRSCSADTRQCPGRPASFRRGMIGGRWTLPGWCAPPPTAHR